ncbi:hypothetical protein LPJ38_10095 [Bradyrhizobium daqingense]|uniref:Uncharacterized protein n=1 Tax=Bradyrhizobium daqingense TaxID=993502 RepID=A0A562L4I7_9BRAD|nr:hypothetical protein [Bradyrhizobium daqingense]TWI02587.1 hypothetical protein IQ17_04203 [Bradyrhizobium daqingense]UFS91050.1 hypothetical protein LPJ38_10095 [Bradyrhizobium daqingense]
MHQAASLQFERVVDEFARWLAVPEEERSPAPAWWWGSAIAMLDEHQPMPSEWSRTLGLGNGSVFADGARLLLALFGDQTSMPWPDDFPRKAESKDDEARELHPQPSDDSAFQP